MNTTEPLQQAPSQQTESSQPRRTAQLASDGSEFIDARPQAVAQRRLQEAVQNCHQVRQLQALQQMAKTGPRTMQLKANSVTMNASVAQAAGAPKPNKTGLPDNLKAGVESLSGMSMDNVKVHYNSSQPAQLNAHAYAHGSEIHVAPGQEKHLPHEAWHVVQQKQSRVKPTGSLGGTEINTDKGLEKEADLMGARAAQMKAIPGQSTNKGLDQPRLGEASMPAMRQAMANERAPLSSSPPGPATVQRVATVVPTQRDRSVVIKADGEASDFTGGDEAKSRGWNGVTKYKARVEVGDERIESRTYSNDYLAAQAGHVLAQQNGGLGSDEDNVFAQDGGVNNGPYRSEFENPMRKALNEAEDDDRVSFRAVLYGENITQGRLSKVSDDLHASSEDTDGTSSDEASNSDVEEELTFEDWRSAIGDMAMEEYGLGLDDLPDEPYMVEFEGGMSAEDFYAHYMADGKAI